MKKFIVAAVVAMLTQTPSSAYAQADGQVSGSLNMQKFEVALKARLTQAGAISKSGPKGELHVNFGVPKLDFQRILRDALHDGLYARRMDASSDDAAYNRLPLSLWRGIAADPGTAPALTNRGSVAWNVLWDNLQRNIRSTLAPIQTGQVREIPLDEPVAALGD